jgi:hypothetical protein
VFASGKLLGEKAAEVMEKYVVQSEKDEYFTSHIISQMIADDKRKFIGIPITKVLKNALITKAGFACVGTPAQLDAFLLFAKGPVGANNKPRRFCFDLDGTLVSFPKVTGDYSTCDPIPGNIEMVRELHQAGHHIIIQTASMLINVYRRDECRHTRETSEQSSRIFPESR